jgi:hypothetical protein
VKKGFYLNGSDLLEECGEHSPAEAVHQAHGIDYRLLDEVDQLIRVGGTAAKIVKELHRIYPVGNELYDMIPAVQKIKNRIKTIRKADLKIDSLYALQSFLRDKKVYVKCVIKSIVIIIIYACSYRSSVLEIWMIFMMMIWYA